MRFSRLGEQESFLRGFLHCYVLLHGNGRLKTTELGKKGEGGIYLDAIVEYLKGGLCNVQRYIDVDGRVCFYDHKRNTKGKLVSVKAKVDELM